MPSVGGKLRSQAVYLAKKERGGGKDLWELHMHVQWKKKRSGSADSPDLLCFGGGKRACGACSGDQLASSGYA